MAISKVKSVFSTYTLDDSNETKNYHRVLFKPGVSVQARELTELQTNLQRQIDYHGQYTFKEGSRVIGGEVALTVDYDYIKVESTMTTGSTTYNSASFISTIANTVGATLTNDNGVKAEVIQVISEAGVDLKTGSNKTGILDSGNTSDPLTLYIKYTSGSGDTESNTFVAGEVLTSSTDTNHKLMIGGGVNTDGNSTNSTISNAVGKGSRVSINEGSYFISGNFVYVAEDSLILDKYSTTPNFIVGLNIIESVITSTDDTSLVDNAAGYPNFSAPGAERYKITTQLIKADPANPHGAYTNYIILFKVENGVKHVEIAAAGKDAAELTKRLARRTHEESGNYSIKPYVLNIKDKEDDNTKYTVGIEPNVAYVQGFRLENISTKNLVVDKPRNTNQSNGPLDYVEKNNISTTLSLGNYVRIDTSDENTSQGLPDITNFNEIALIDSSGGATDPIALVDTIAFSPTTTGLEGTYIVKESDSGVTGADGTGAEFKIIIDSNDHVIVEVLDGGQDYNVDSSFTILGTVFGGSSTADDLTFDVAQLGHGRARCRAMSYESANIFRLYLFDIVMTRGTFAQIDKVEQLTNVTGGGIFFADLLADSVGTRFDAGNNSAVYKLPSNYIKDAQFDDKPSYQIQKRFYVEDCPSAGTHTFSAALAADENLIGSVIMSVGSSNSDTAYAKTQFVTATTTGSAGSAKALTVADSDIVSNKSLCVIATVEVDGSDTHLKTKTFNTVSDAQYKFDGTNPILLNAYDIYSVVSIKQGSSSGPDITNRFKLDNGQRPNFYEEGRLIPISNISEGDVYITFHHYTHSAGDYFTKNSYDNISDSSHKLENIPTLKLPSGSTVDLKDCIDFRPAKHVSGDYSNNYSGTTDSTFANGKLSRAVAPGAILNTDIEVWLARIDKLVLSRDGNYSIIKGVSAENPVPPEDPQDSMVIGLLRVKPYVYDSKADVLPTLNDHKRYTMRHIGEIDQRLKKLEYYSALSMLETETLNISIPDNTSATNTFERFKNGIFAEPFKGHDNGHVNHPDYHCAIDKSIGVLRPKFDEQCVNLVRKTGDTGVVKNSSIYTLPYTSVEYIKQPVATGSEFVNPYNVFTWAGVLELSPNTDEWKDVEHRPDVIINDDGQYDQLVALIEDSNILGTVWNEWETNWTGVDRQVETYVQGQEKAWRTRLRRRGGTWQQPGWVVGDIVTTTTTNIQSRAGLTTSMVPDVETREMGSKVVETNFIPFIRSREIFFKGSLMKPNTKLYAFFDDIDVTNYCAEKAFEEFSDRSAVEEHTDKTQHDSNDRGVLTTDGSGYIEGSFFIPNNSSLRFRTGTRLFRLTDEPTNDRSEQTTFAETNYAAEGLLEVMENTIISTKVPRLVTTEVNEDRVVTDRSVSDNRTTTWYDPLAQTILIDQIGGLFTTELDIFIKDKDPLIPLNVSIRECENGIPTQRIVPGTETILNPVNGTGSDINKVYDSHVSDTGTTPCTVTFEYPVYLAQDTEYAIVLISNSDIYKVFIADTGDFNLENGERVAKQPYNGVFFTSQNASTWTPNQYRDLKFTLKRAEFSSGDHTLVLTNDQLPTKKLKADPFFVCTASATNSAVLRVTHPDHGMMEGSSVEISGAATFNTNITNTLLNTTHTISDVERDSYVITVTISGSPGDVEILGGGSGVRATENMIIDTLVPYNQTLQLPETNITYDFKGYTARSTDGTQDIFTEIGPLPLSANNNNYFNSPIAIASTAEHGANTGSLNGASNHTATNKSFAMTCTFSSTNPYLSPIIDANRSSVFCISNRTNDATNNSGNSHYNKTSHGRTYVADTVATGNSNLNNYITREIVLANEASQLNVFTEAYKPTGADILLYFKVKESGDERDFDEIGWTLLPPTVAIPHKDAGNTNVEYQVNLETDNLASGLPDTFSSFAFKVVLITTNSSRPPMIRNLRSIATT